MVERKPLSKRIRFEVFKRDKFTCQYCGSVAPNVILEVDHIDPVSKGGGNEILNLLTSCVDCNRGKSDKELSDDSAVAKQRQQMELLQERREQIEQMFEWRKGLDSLRSDLDEMVINYIEDKIEDFILNENGKKNVPPLTKKYAVADILEAVDLSAEQYLRYDDEGNLTHESTGVFLDKIKGILVIKNKPPIEQKAAYIKGICRNRFSYWDQRSGSIVLNNYIRALRDHGWSEQNILDDLENEVIPKTKEKNSWSEWRSWLEAWTESVKGWATPEEIEPERISQDELDAIVEQLIAERTAIVPALIHIGKEFENVEEESLLDKIDATVLDYLIALEDYAKQSEDEREFIPTYHLAGYSRGLLTMFDPYDSVNATLCIYLQVAAEGIFDHFFCTIDQYRDNSPEFDFFNYIRSKYYYLVVSPNEDENSISTEGD